MGGMRPVFEWNIGSRTLQLGKRTLIMGVLNVTPDSFSDGGLYLDRDRAVEQGLRLLEDGATRSSMRRSPWTSSMSAENRLDREREFCLASQKREMLRQAESLNLSAKKKS